MESQTIKKTNNANVEKTNMKNISIDDKIKNFQLYVDQVKPENGSVFIKGFVESPFTKEEMSICVVNALNDNELICQISPNEKNDERILSEDNYQYFFETQIPVSDKLIFEFNVNINECQKSFNPKVFFTPTSLLNRNFNKITKNDYILSFDKNQFSIDKKEYIFSVIIPSFDSYCLEKQLKSIFSHGVNSENIQVIILNNQYNEDTKDIALKYKKQHPNNVFYINRTSFEINSLINTGAGYAIGNYIRILDPDEKMFDFELDYAKELIKENQEKVFSFNTGEFISFKEKEMLSSEELNRKITYADNKHLENLIKDNYSKNIKRILENESESDKENAANDLINKSDDLSKRKVRINHMHVDCDNLHLIGEYDSSGLDDVEIRLIMEENGEKIRIPCETTEYISKSNISEDIEKITEFEVSVPLGIDKNIKVYFENILDNEMTTTPELEYKNSNTDENRYCFCEKYHISKEDDCLNISRGYAFSIVIAIYNTENYLEECLDSVINQTIGFEDNVQLILVNDGSPDNSKDICLKYAGEYPDNIVYIEQKNAGQATARNNGLKYVKGRYVNFLDSDDYLEENALDKVYPFFRRHDNEVDIVAMPIKFFGRKENYHMLHDKFKNEGIIDLEKNPNNPQLSSSSAFIKKYLFDDFTFPTNVISSEDTIILNKILLRRKKYGVVKDTTYYYRKRFDESSTIDSVAKQKEFFTDKMKYYFLELVNYSLKMEKEVVPFIQYLIAYDIQWMLKEPDISILNDEEKDEFFEDLRNVMKYIDRKCIRNNKFVTNSIFKSFFMKVKNDEKHVEIKDDVVCLKSFDYEIDNLTNHRLWLDIVEIEDNTLKISGFINSHFNLDETLVVAQKESEGNISYYDGKYVKYTSRENVKFISEDWQYKYNFDIEVPLNVGEKTHVKLVTKYFKDGNKLNDNENNVISCILRINFTKHAKISGISNYIVKDDYILFFEENTFKIDRYSYKLMKKYEKHVQNKIIKFKRHNYKQALKIRNKYLKLYPLIRRYKRNHQIHIYMDRLDVADDNSEHLFRYASKQHDGVKKYYVLSEDSPDFNRVGTYGNIVKYKSEKNKLLYLMADKVISTHPYESGINPFFSYDQKKDERENYSGLINSKIYFLQHGVTKDNISDWMSKYDKNLSLLVTVSDLERESFDVEGYGYDPKIIQTLGFPRYDNLKNNPGKQILIIPTWRKYLRGNKNLFLNSDYFKSLNGLLNNEEFIDSARKMGYNIVFKAHPELEKNINDTDERYIDLFDINEDVKLSTEESYQELFNNSSLLITDYSSVFFDFAYQKKPVIYYHPSDDYHYQEGYFDYESMGFGEIIDNEKSLINTITNYMEKDCKMKDKYSERVDAFFKYTDKNNSKRVYEWIKSH